MAHQFSTDRHLLPVLLRTSPLRTFGTYKLINMYLDRNCWIMYSSQPFKNGAKHISKVIAVSYKTAFIIGVLPLVLFIGGGGNLIYILWYPLVVLLCIFLNANRAKPFSMFISDLDNFLWCTSSGPLLLSCVLYCVCVFSASYLLFFTLPPPPIFHACKKLFRNFSMCILWYMWIYSNIISLNMKSTDFLVVILFSLFFIKTIWGHWRMRGIIILPTSTLYIIFISKFILHVANTFFH